MTERAWEYGSREVAAECERDAREFEEANTTTEDEEMLYEIRATANGHEVKRMVSATSDEQALSKFVTDWTEHGDAEPAGIEIIARWSQE